MATANIVKWGNSRAIRLSRNLLDSVNLSENDTVEIIVENNSIIITKANKKKHKTLKERLVGHEGNYIFEELSTGAAVGREIINDEGYSNVI